MGGRTRAVVAAAVLLVAGACGGSGGGGSAGGTGVYGDPGAEGAGTTAPRAGAGAASAGGSRAPATTGADRGAGGGGGSAAAPTATAPRVGASGSSGAGGAAKQVTVSGPPGSYARPLLRTGDGQAILLDLLAQEGAALRPSAVDHLVAVLKRESGKAVTTSSTTIPDGPQQWTADDLTATADQRSANKATPDRHVVHVLAVHGTYEQAGVLGIAVRGDVYAVFTDEVGKAGSPLVPAAVIEEAVSTHELGHVLGLVDLVLDTNRGDPDHPGHSKSRGSVMYWAVDSDLVTQVIGGAPATDFDADDRADLAAMRSGK
jgi:hypothetical protein